MMFSKIIDSIRSNTNRNTTDTATTAERRSSTDEDNSTNNNNNNYHHLPPPYALTKLYTTGSIPTSPTTSMDEASNAIPITRRRRSSLFGYSQNATDDYMQKDLISSSWS